MKKLLIITILLLSVKSFSQTGFNHLTLKGGLTLDNARNYELGYEMNKKYFNNFSLFFSVYEKDIDLDKLYNFTFGLYYEPSLKASKNSFVNLKFGSSFGTNETKFIFDIIVGLEYNYAITENLKLTIYQKNNNMFNADLGFRHALLFGIKYRL